MPERPKRRKNNKNKRKNKANKPDSSKNASDLNNTSDKNEPCSSSNHNGNEEVKVENKVVDNIVRADIESVASIPEVQSIPGTSCGELELIEDLNNNNSNLQVLNTEFLTVETIPANDNIEIPAYVVESPDQPIKSKAKLSCTVKSKSLDNDDDTKIVEITDECIAVPVDNSTLDVVDSNNVIITDVESDVEWEKTDDFNDERPVAQELATGSLSITTIPLNVAQCGQTKCLTTDEEKSLRNYLRTLNLSTQPENLNSIEIKTEIEEIINHEIKQRLRKKGSAEDIFTHRLGPPRILDVIDEEGSSESSMTSRRQSYLSEKKSDVEDLDDDVFEDKIKSSKQSKVQKYASTHTQHRTIGRLVPQECVLVGAKIKEPEVSEARGNWTMKTVEKMTGAEIVYLTDTSSSTSSLHEIEDDDDGIETDVSVRMITPTIEVTDTENFLKKSFISDNNKDLKNVIETKTCDQTKNDTFNTQVKSEEDLNENSKQSNHNDVKNVERVIKIDLINDSTENKQSDVDNTTKIERIIKIEYEKDLEKDDQHVNEHSKCAIIGKNDSVINIQVEKEYVRSQQHVSHSAEIYKTNNTITDLKAVSEETNDKSNPYQAKDTKRSVNVELHNLPKAKQESIIQNIQEEFLYKNNATQNSHEIVVLSTDDIKTNLYVKDISENENKENDTNIAQNNKTTLDNMTKEAKEATQPNEYDLETKIIKCEFNDAINNLIKEVSSDSETSNENLKDTFSRQDSSSSVSSQCTTKYNPNYSSLNDVSNTHDDTSENNNSNMDQTSSNTSHVKDVFECVTGPTQSKDKTEVNANNPLKLRDLCVKRIALLPYGERILEELASVSQRLQNIAILGSSKTSSGTTTTKKIEKIDNMPYFPLPDVSSIEKISLQTKVKDPIPPPVQPRHSSLKKSQEDDHWTGVPTKTEPVYVCLSPSQKMLMDKTNTVITKEDASHLVDMHRKFVDRRGYNETYTSQTQKEESDSDNPLVVPFKSQTGSRLLALIRDPNLTRNINSLNQRLHYSLDGLQKKYPVKETISKNYNERFNAVRDVSFKPIPPPRPKKLASSFYESDESSDFTDNSMRSMKSERKFFHFSTGNLNKEIEHDISSIQNMHRFYTTTRNEASDNECPRRPSLPKDLCEQQMEYIRKKEKEVEAEIQRLEALNNKAHVMQRKGPRAPLITEKETRNERVKDQHNCFMSHKRDFTISSQGSDSKKGHHEQGRMSSLFSSSQEEINREKMYSEYVTQMAERQERKQHKIIKITNAPDPCSSKIVSKSMSALDVLDSKVNNRIEKEFISKARERWDKLGIRDPETEDERESAKNLYKEPIVIEHKIKVMEAGEEKDVKKLPSHLQEFVRFTAKDADQGAGSSVVWRPGAPTPPPLGAAARSPGGPPPPPPPPPVWTPGSAGASPHSPRKTFRPVHFEETPPTRRKFPNSEQNGCTSGSESEGRLRTSHSAPVTGLNSLGGTSATSRLPKAQNPTVTLLQKAREGQIPRGATYLQQERDAARLPRDRPSPPRGDPVHALRKEYASEGEAERSDHERGGSRKMADAHRKVEGIGPTTKDGMPVALRSEVKDPSRWYKKMYDTIHKNKYDDDYVTIRYKSRRGEPPERVSSNKSQYAYFDPRSGYLSEPEGGLSRLGFSTWSDAYDSDVTTGPRRRTASVQEERRISDATSQYLPNNKFSTLASARASHEVYKNQPGRIENYMPGKSSVVDKEAKQWWDEVMDIFDGWLDDNSPLPPYTTLLARAIQKSQNISSTTSLPQASPKDKKDLTSTILSKSNMARALKESGYESDSTLVFRRRDDAVTPAPLSPAERRAAYRDLQAGGEPPLRGFRSPAPPRQDESEIEYIPISPTLTKIRVHKKTPKVHEVICYPVTSIETTNFKKQMPSFLNYDIPSQGSDYPPAPPRRVSSKNSRTLKLVTSTRPVSVASKTTLPPQSQSNVDFLKDKINLKLTRQNTQIITKTESIADRKAGINHRLAKNRVMSTSAPPAINRKNTQSIPTKTTVKSDTKILGTSSFGSARRTLLPIEYSNFAHSKYREAPSSVTIERGAGRRTPISNILDKVTTLDKLWSAEKRNERIDLTKARAKSLSKENNNIAGKGAVIKTTPTYAAKSTSPTITHKSRDMIRTAEKVQKLKVSKLHTKSNPCLSTKNDHKTAKSNTFQSTTNISKSSSNISAVPKKQIQIKTAVVTNLKKKKSLESVIVRPRSVPCHESCSKKSKENNKSGKKVSKSTTCKKSNVKPNDDSESGSQFGDTSNETSNFGSFENLGAKRITSKEIKKSHDAVVSDTFFQHLFLGRTCAPIMAYPMLEPNTTVLQKARMFQSLPQDNITPKSLNTYLIHRKPVSLSRFKMWDRYSSPARSQSPRSVSWPGRMHGDIRKFDSLSKCDEFGSTSSLATVRSRSEPPANKIYFSQTTRPKSPTVLFYKRERSSDDSPLRNSISPSRLVLTQTTRPISPKVSRKIYSSGNQKSLSPSKIVFTETARSVSPSITRHSPYSDILNLKPDIEKSPPTMFFSQTSRPVSPKVITKTSTINSISRSHSTSPVSIRSPSYRRIHSARIQSGKIYHTDTITKNVPRTRSAGDADKNILRDSLPHKTKSYSNLHGDDPDYDEYIRDMQDNKVRSERFRELNRYYAYLERVAELEKATSTCDLRHRRKDEEIIDFDRWKKIRAIERAEEELNNLYRKLKIAQSEKDVLFYPRDLKDFRWSYDTDRGLRTKEKSVEDLKDHFQQVSHYDSIDSDQTQSKDTYKPLWRGTSVAETAFYINKKTLHDKKGQRLTVKPTITLQQDSSLSELRKKIGLGSRLWSSLSMEQVNALKNQLNAIYSREIETKSNKEYDKYTIDVKDDNIDTNSPLHVRCNSLITSDHISDRPSKLTKSDSIAAISCPITSVKELKNNVNKIQMTLSENEKRKISQTLSKEILDRINKFDNIEPISLKEEIENSEMKRKTIVSGLENKDSQIATTSLTQFFQDNKENANNIVEEKKRHIVYPNEKTETLCQSSASETETASSDLSSKTVIYRGPSKEVQKKVKYFESVKKLSDQSNTIYHARESSDEKENQDKNNFAVPELVEETEIRTNNEAAPVEPPKNQIVQSQSCTNIKEFFGEIEKNKFLSLPSKPDLHSRSVSPHSEVNVMDRRTPDTLRYSSDETIWRSRSPSPDPERYWRAYLNLARAGEVRRLARRFDSPSAAGAVLRRHRSDPEIARNSLNSTWSSFERISRRDKHKSMLPVARVPLRPTNRFMPHIDIISKLAALRRRSSPRSRSAEDALECRPGEVDRIRRRFEAMSLLGQIYASAPDVSELHDIAPYLAGSWVAHRYPKQSDNNRSIEDPKIKVRGRTSPVKKETKRSIPKESLKLSSILKSDAVAKQEFDPAVHRPASRYEPPRAPPRPPPASWPYRLSPFVTPSRHTVTFQETDSAPEPPRRASQGSYSDTESPRRYVESDVNIHYRCPVRHDPLPLVPERELARQQAEHMKRLYREQRRNKYLQENDIQPADIEAFDASMKELQDMQNRRHQDNFTPSQKTVVPLNRYDEADKVIAAKALYTFNGQTQRELSFKKGDLIHVRRQIDNNWYEGELHGRIGLFPYNYVEIQKGDVIQAPKKSAIVEGRARAKFDFTAQTNLELPLKKGEVVVITRRIDQNWWEGRNGSKTGIFPDSYITVLQEPSQTKPEPPVSSEKPVASPAAHGLLNGSAKRSMGSHSYTPQPNSPALSNAPQPTQPLPGYVAKPAQATLSAAERGYGPPAARGVDLNNTEPLYVDTNAEAIPYRAMYKYRPQNPDELELNEGDTVYVLEKCDDGWYVGSSQRTGRFGTFPGNYVERI